MCYDLRSSKKYHNKPRVYWHKKTYTNTIIVIYYIIILFYKYLYVIIYAPATLLVFVVRGDFRSRMCIANANIIIPKPSGKPTVAIFYNLS